MAFAASIRSNTAQVPYSFVKERSQLVTALGKKPSRPTHPQEDGGGERTRTDDLLRARQALSQLSYTPFATNLGTSVCLPKFDCLLFGQWQSEVVGLSGVEPLTSRLSGVRSNRN
jgi:hypothetical protein